MPNLGSPPPSSNMTAANVVSLLRLLSVPFLAYFFVEGTYRWVFWIFIAASISDALDGYLARRLQSTTPIGRMLDPIADKVMLITVFYLLGHYDYLPLWLVFLSISRDLAIILGILILQWKKRPFTTAPAFVSKLNTTLQMILVLWTLGNLLYAFPFPFIKESLIYIVLFTTLLSWYDYIVLWIKLMKGGSERS